MRVSLVSMGDNFLNMGDRKISMAFTYRKHVVYDLKVLDLRLKSPILTTQKSKTYDPKVQDL